MPTTRLEDSTIAKVEDQRSTMDEVANDSFRQELFSGKTKWSERIIPRIVAAQNEKEIADLTFARLPELEASKPKEQRVKKPYIAEKLPERVTPAGESASVGSNEKDLPNFHKVDELMYRGGQPGTKEALEKLKEQGVTKVVDFRGPIPIENVPDDMKADFEKKNQRLAEQQEREKQWCKELGLDYVSIPMTSGDGPSEEQINQFLGIAELEKEELGKIFAHDEHGSDREGAMMYAYRIAFNNFTPEQAREEMLKYGYRQRANGTDVYENMTETIEGWAKDYTKRQKKD